MSKIQVPDHVAKSIEADLKAKEQEAKQETPEQDTWCQEKQWVLIGRYAGARFKLGDESECRIINDDEVIATILDPDDILAV